MAEYDIHIIRTIDGAERVIDTSPETVDFMWSMLKNADADLADRILEQAFNAIRPYVAVEPNTYRRVSAKEWQRMQGV